MPRIRALFSSGFGSIAFIMAHIYNMVKLLPITHPYLDKNNIGQFGIRHVIAEAANNLVVKKENWDQILIFMALMTGFILLIAQVALIIVAILFEPVFAQSATNFTGSLFVTPAPMTAVGDTKYSTDVAFLLLDRVFGIPGFFCAAGNVCTDVLVDGRWPFHIALHSMFKFYSMGLLIIAVIIFLYFVVVIVGETATTGSPFGERFQNVWVPIRLVVALGLLTPIHYGLNSGQYIGLYTAKIGSSMATNAWHRFNNTIKDGTTGGRANPTGESSNLLALPAAADLTPIVQFMSLVHACAYSEWRYDTTRDASGSFTTLQGGKPKGLRDIDTLPVVPPKDTFYIKPYFVKSALSTVGAGGDPDGIATKRQMLVAYETPYDEALDFYGNGDIIIRFGKLSEDDAASKYTGNVAPTCGEISIPISDLSYRNSDTELEDINLYGGAPMVQRFYYNLIKQMWYGEGSSPGVDGTVLNQKLLRHFSQRYAEFTFPENSSRSSEADPSEEYVCQIGCDNAELPSCKVDSSGTYPCKTTTPDRQEFVGQIVRNYKAFSDTEIRTAWESYNANGISHKMSDDIYDRGWGGAGIWYNAISQINGGFVNAVFSTPSPIAMPQIMEDIRNLKKKKDPNASGIDQYNPITSEKKDVSKELGPNGQEKAAALFSIYQFWSEGNSFSDDEDKTLTGNPFIDVMNFIFGTEGVFAIRGENSHIHPLAQLSSIGKGIVNSSIRNLGISTGLSIMGGPISSLSEGIAGPLAKLGASLFSTTAFVGLTAGVVLFYILPLQPFIFFFFAVAGWVKALFEAMVGIPLWALAHMRLDGEGLPGEAAQNGYFLIFELFLRPILIVFGLIAASIIFAAQVRTLHFIWDMVVDNVGGFSGNTEIGGPLKIKRGIIDQFFFTIIYTIIVYMMATASFKLIDMIPDSIMRWAGNGVSAFGDADKNPAAGLQRMAATGGLIQGQKIIGAGTAAAGQTGDLLGKAMADGPKIPGR